MQQIFVISEEVGIRLTVNDTVHHIQKGKAIIRYIGELETRNGALTYGIELLEAIGKNNGCDKRGRFMFPCRISRGMFVKRDDIKLVSPASTLDMVVKPEYDTNSDSNSSDDDSDESNESDDSEQTSDIEDVDGDESRATAVEMKRVDINEMQVRKQNNINDAGAYAWLYEAPVKLLYMS